MKLSICIPTFNRSRHLANCLNAIIQSASKADGDFQICVSDNASTDDTEGVVRSVQGAIPIKYVRNKVNIGAARNYLNAVAMADGDFVWLVGDDDLLLPSAIDRVLRMIDENGDIDYFCVNAFHLTTDYVQSFPHPFDMAKLPEHMEPFSSWPNTGKVQFLDLIDPKVSFDFLGGIFLSVFKRDKWMSSAHVVDTAACAGDGEFASLDETFPHIKIFAKAFSNSNAFFCAQPLTVCLTGAREWAPKYRFIRSVHLVSALGEYRKNGLSRAQYHRCKNFALRTFLPDLAYMFVHRKTSGISNVRPLRVFLQNCLYPNTYLSIGYHVVQKMKSFYGQK